jgi:hypothetical protein
MICILLRCHLCTFHLFVSRLALCLVIAIALSSSSSAYEALNDQQGEQVQGKKESIERLKKEKEELEKQRKQVEEDAKRLKSDNKQTKQSKGLSEEASDYVNRFVEDKFLKCGNVFYAKTMGPEQRSSSLRVYCVLEMEGLSVKTKGDSRGDGAYDGSMIITAGAYTAYCWAVGGYGASQSSHRMPDRSERRLRQEVSFGKYREGWSTNNPGEFNFLDAPQSCQAPIEGPPQSRSTQDESYRQDGNNRLPSSRFGFGYPSSPSGTTQEDKRIQDYYKNSIEGPSLPKEKSNASLLSKVRGTWEFYWPSRNQDDPSRTALLEINDGKIIFKVSGDELVEQLMDGEEKGEEFLLTGSNPRIVNEPSFDKGFPAPGYSPDQIRLQRQAGSNPKVFIRDNVNVKDWQPVQVSKVSTQKDEAGKEILVVETNYNGQLGSLILKDEKVIYRQFSRYDLIQKMNIQEIDGTVSLSGYDVLISDTNHQPFRYTPDQLRFKLKPDGTFEVETRDGVNVKDWTILRVKSYKEK